MALTDTEISPDAVQYGQSFLTLDSLILNGVLSVENPDTDVWWYSVGMAGSVSDLWTGVRPLTETESQSDSTA